jgi:hypothetical protein
VALHPGYARVLDLLRLLLLSGRACRVLVCGLLGGCGRSAASVPTLGALCAGLCGLLLLQLRLLMRLLLTARRRLSVIASGGGGGDRVGSVRVCLSLTSRIAGSS